MSHFAVAVFTKKNQQVEDLLAPYQENSTGCPKEYLAFYNSREEHKDEYEKESTEMVEFSDGHRTFPWKDEVFIEISEDEYNKLHSNPEYATNLRKHVYGQDTKYYCRDYEKLGAKLIVVPFKEIYPTFEEFLEEWIGDEFNEEGGDYGYWENPNAKWDWWSYGGRFGGLKKKNDDDEDSDFASFEAYVKDIDFTPDQEEYNAALRWWEVAIEKQPLKPGEDEDNFFTFYKDEYYLNRYKTKEQYAKIVSSFTTFAVVTPDGKWHEKGEMGWFGCSGETDEEALDWDLHYKERFIDTADPDWVLTIVDCHI